MALPAGSRLGAYEITGPIGAGGMGEVYRARDARLNRDVAIKILPQSLADDPHRIARFEREAQVLAALNHPNIAHIYGLEKLDVRDGGGTALVMELVEGPTLADLIAAGTRTPEAESLRSRPRDKEGSVTASGGGAPRALIEDTLATARQIAAALEAAHAQGIIHRDLKPANIKVREDGTVKVLDFGLAAYRGGADSSSGAVSDLSNSPTISSPAMTHAGMILGTAAYMSPEQARGKTVDKRADIWAFGVVLFEMLAGRRAFDAEDVSLTLAEVMRGEPDWKALPTDIPHNVRTVLTRCLQKDPRQRFHDMGDVRLALDGAFNVPVERDAARSPDQSRWSRAIPWVAGAIAGSLIAGVVAWRMMPEPPVRAVARFTIEAPGNETLIGAGVAVSPINGEIIFVGRGARPPQRMFRREPDQLESTPIGDTNGAGQPEFSPDGRWIAFGAGPELKKVAAGGGPSSSIYRATNGRTVGNISWSDDGRIAFGYVGDGDPTYVVPATGGEARELTALDTASGELDQRTPDWLPGSDAILFTSWRGALETNQIVVQRISSGERRVLASGSHPQFAEGYLLFTRGEALWGAPFDPVRLEFLAEPIPVQEGIGANLNGIAVYAVGRDGSLAYATGAGAAGGAPLRPRTLVWVDRAGREEAINVPPRAYTYARLSPDNTRAALDARDGQSDIWIWNFARETLDRLTVDPGLNRGPSWTPDSTRVAFSAVRDGLEAIYWQAADGSGQPQRINDGTEPAVPVSFSPDGTKLLFITPPSVQPYNLGMLTLGPPPRSEILLGAAYNEGNGIISPDGRWLAYESNESGTAQIYVRPFPDVNSAREQVSNGGGTRPLWSRDGKELFYYRGPNQIMSVSVTPGTRLVLGRPQVVVEGPYAIPVNAGTHYDVSSDGHRFLLLRDADVGTSDSQPHITVVLNWIEEVKRLFPR